MDDAQFEVTLDELRQQASKWRRDQSQRQSAIDAKYADRRDAVINADIERMMNGQVGEYAEATTVRR